MALKVGELFATLGLESSTFAAGLTEAKNALEQFQSPRPRGARQGTFS